DYIYIHNVACKVTKFYSFFFSSRRRHTRFSRDWSSDVCSSDLATDRFNKSTLVSKAYSGASLRRQAHAFADDFVAAVPNHGKGIAQTKIAFKGETGPNSEIFISDFDGYGAKSVTRDNTIVAAPCFVPGHLALYYTSYKLNHPD